MMKLVYEFDWRIEFHKETAIDLRKFLAQVAVVIELLSIV